MDSLFYDKIVGSIMGNILSEKNINKKIILKGYNDNDPAHKLYLNAAVIISDLSNEPIFINSSFLTFVKLKWRRRKLGKQIRYLKAINLESIDSEITPIDTIIDYVCRTYNIEREVMTEINNTYYGGM